MKIISYRPADDQFWIGCTKEEAEKFFIPLLNEDSKNGLSEFLRHCEMYDDEYREMVCETMGIEELSYMYFNVSRDLKICYYDVPHHPFHQLWNAYSPFVKCDFIEISHTSELKNVVPTFNGKIIKSV